jgi:hypothetical protein
MMRRLIPTVLIFFFGVLLYSQAGTGTKQQRNYMMVFDVIEYTPQLKNAVTHFFDNVIQPTDQLIVITPVKTYGYTSAKLSGPKKQLIAEFLKRLKTDVAAGASRYRSILNEMSQTVESLGDSMTTTLTSVKGILKSYRRNRQNLAALRGSYEPKLLEFATIFRRVKGDNHLLMFLQRIGRPIPDTDTLEWIRTRTREGSADVAVFLEENLKTDLDYHKLEAAFKYANVKFHFLYLQSKTFRKRRGIDYVDVNQDLYSIFSKLSTLTSGIKLSTAKATSFIKQVEMVVTGTVEVEVKEEEMK